MKKTKKALLWVAGGLVTLGVCVSVFALTMIDGGFSELSKNKYETNTYEIAEDFGSISINTKTADITLLLSDGEKCKAVCYEDKKLKHTVLVQDGVLTVNTVDTRKWYDYIGINWGTPKITLYLPKSEYTSLFIKGSTGDVDIPNDFVFADVDISLSTGDINFLASTSQLAKITTTTGDILAENISAGKLDLSTSTGNIEVSRVSCEGDIKIKLSTGKTNITDVTCKTLSTSGSTGDVYMKNVIASEKLSVKRSTGDVKLEGCDGAEISVMTDTGDVKGSLLTDKIFVARSDTGKVNVPKTAQGGRCDITTDTGNIVIKIEK